MIRHITGSLLLLLVFTAEATLAQMHVYQKKANARSEVIGRKGIVATSHPLATQVAIDILKLGGNAVDAAIAANAILALVEPVAAGIGGDLEALIWDAATAELYGLSAVGKSPAALTPEFLRKSKIKEILPAGMISVTVPGCVDGWQEMHKKFGKLSIEEILAPAISYANDGFPVTEAVAEFWQLEAQRLKDIPSFAEVFIPGGQLPAKGELFRNPSLANTFKRLSEAGLRDFYEGDIAGDIVSHFKSNNGFLTSNDLELYHSQWVSPVSTNYRGFDIWALPPSNQGIILLGMMNIMKEKDIRSMGANSSELLHLFVESKKLVYEDRDKLLGDKDAMRVAPASILSEQSAKEKFMAIKTDKAGKSDPKGLAENDNTVYITVADRFGNMVSLVQNNYMGMGSGVVVPTLGFVFQNRAVAFLKDQNRPNSYNAAKKPVFTAIPGFVSKAGKPWLCFGITDGKMQIQGHAQVLIDMVDFELKLQKTADAGRFYHESSVLSGPQYTNESGWLILEKGFNYEIIRELMKKGHRIKFDVDAYGGFLGIMRDTINGVYYGAAESRFDGQVSGY